MKLSLSRVAALVAVVFCAVTALALVVGPGAGKARAATPASDATRPTLTVTTLAGKSFDLQAQRGKWVVVNYWATWCAPCIKEMPALSAFVSSRPKVTAIGLAYESQSADKIRAFVRKHPVNYSVALVDPAHPPPGIAMPSVLPTTFLIAPDGHLVKKLIGPLDMDELASIIGKQVKP
ncbi:MAG TPA: TlpA disulfide reductase family protein [Oleiagrimonas sp.]|nr:TlpA disulfide reductase family protein [Oleiagrimonas sp.]